MKKRISSFQEKPMDTSSSRKRTIPNALFFEQVVELLALGKKVKIPVIGNSMRPFLHDGDTALLAPVEEAKLKRGDVVLAYCREDSRYVLHRIVFKIKEIVFLAGDGNFFQLEKVRAADIVAVAVEAIRGERAWHMDTLSQRWKGLVWFALRPCRAVAGKLVKLK